MIPDFFTNLICIAVGRIYPAFGTYKAIKASDKDAFLQWLMYWVCFAVYSTVECVADIFLRFWFPFYNEIKIGFLLMLLSHEASGAVWFYNNIICPHLDENEQTIERYIEHGKLQAMGVFRMVCKEFITRFNKLARAVATQIHMMILNQIRENILLNEDGNVSNLPSQIAPSTSSDSYGSAEVSPISTECEKFTLIREEDGEYSLVPMDLTETVLPDPGPRKRGRPRKNAK